MSLFYETYKTLMNSVSILLFFFSGNGLLATWGTVIGFVVMMCLDVGLG